VTPRGRGRLAAAVALALTAATGLLGLATAPAIAAACSGKGVNVVVDYNGLGGGVQRGCDPGGGNETADRVFPDAGFPLSYAQRQPGFVCRVKGAPSSDPCVNASPANAYWGLYWSDGKSGRWTYSSSGVGSLKVPDGGFLAFSWQDGGPADPPGAAAVNNQPAPTRPPKPAPSKAPSKAPSPAPTRGDGSGGGAGGVSIGGGQTGNADALPPPSEAGARATAEPPSATASRTRRPAARATPSASASAGASATPSGSPTSDAEVRTLTSSAAVDTASGTDDEGQLSPWVPVGVLMILTAAGGGAALWRRRTNG
jgi:hypothetical protein